MFRAAASSGRWYLSRTIGPIPSQFSSLHSLFFILCCCGSVIYFCCHLVLYSIDSLRYHTRECLLVILRCSDSLTSPSLLRCFEPFASLSCKSAKLSTTVCPLAGLSVSLFALPSWSFHHSIMLLENIHSIQFFPLYCLIWPSLVHRFQLFFAVLLSVLILYLLLSCPRGTEEKAATHLIVWNFDWRLKSNSWSFLRFSLRRARDFCASTLNSKKLCSLTPKNQLWIFNATTNSMQRCEGGDEGKRRNKKVKQNTRRGNLWQNECGKRWKKTLKTHKTLTSHFNSLPCLFYGWK